jgi:glycogen debranching enzyme
VNALSPTLRTPAGPPPVLLTSLSSAVLADGRGDISYARESRGAVAEWGGVYAQLMRLTGPWTIGLASGGALTDLSSCCLDSGPTAGGWRTRHRWNEVTLVQDVVASPRPAGAVRRLSLRSEAERPVPLVLTSRFMPFVFPVLVEGIRPVEFEMRAEADGVHVRNRGFGLRFSSNLRPSRLQLNGDSWDGRKYRGPVELVAAEQELMLAPRGGLELSYQIAGGLQRDLEGALREVGTAPVSLDNVAAHRAGAEASWLARTPELEFPDAPDLEAAYRSARAALYRLYSAPADGIVGLVAGYPWYSSLWSRDIAVMLPALLWLGDFDWVDRSLDSVFRFQSRTVVAMLGGRPGELPMQVAPGPVFLYGTSDTTLRFPGVVEQLHRHTGDLSYVRDWARAVHQIVRWGRARTNPRDGLLRHGGEAEAIGRATAALSKIHYGIASPDTTIWDSADRRDHAIDVQVLWWETLRSAAQLLGHAADDKRRATCQRLATHLVKTLRERYPWPEESYLFDSLRRGRPVAQVRPNALRAVSAGLFDPEFARAIVRRAAADDLTTPWGLRTLSSRDPTYDPRAYHEGRVWTIATAWAADASFVVGDRERGVGYLRTIAARYAEERGFANECYLGDRPEAFDSCYLLGFSVAPFLSALFERLWGIHVDVLAGVVRVVPGFPAAWTSATLRGLRVGDGTIDLRWTPRELRVRWCGTRPLAVDTGTGPRALRSGEDVTVGLPTPPQPS